MRIKLMKIVALLAFAGFAIMPFRVGAQMMGSFNEVSENSEHGESLDVVLSQLLPKYSVDKIQDLDCSKISDDDLEELGDAVMSSIHPNDQVHESMDEMMGGEGSESLKQAHINMARNYLGCGYGDNTMMSTRGGNYGMGGMMNWGMMQGWSGRAGFQSVPHQLFGAITWLSLIAFLTSGTIFFWKKGRGIKNK